MARTKLKPMVVAITVVLLITGLVTMFLTGFLSRGRLKLPVGKGTPAISLGQVHGLILASNGSLWSWGTDFLGWPVLGLGNAPNDTHLHRIGNDTDWVSITAGESHNLAIKSDGTLWAWGENIYGQFGVGTMGKQNVMANIPVPAAPGNDWKQAAAGGVYTIALKKDGTLWAWGNNWAGTSGIGSTNNSAVALRVGSATNWVKVWAGLLETVAMQTDGSLWYWGENPNPAFAQDAGQILVPTRVSPDTNWVDVGFGDTMLPSAWFWRVTAKSGPGAWCWAIRPT